jgi:uncharacterized tellurite resistance protein B-like protein
MLPEEFSYDDFIAYVMIYAAYADLELSSEEKQLIQSKVNADHFDKLMQLYHEQSDMDHIDTFTALCAKFCPEPEDKEKLLQDMVQLFEADHDFSLMEHNFLRALKHLIN